MKRYTLERVAVAAVIAGCAGPAEDQTVTAETETTIQALAGNDVITAGGDQWGLGTYQGRGFCSATRLSDYWVLTAGHCGLSTYLRGSNFTALSTGEVIPVTQTHAHPSADAALLRLSRPPGGQDFKNGFYQGSAASLVGQTVTCFGAGPNVLNGPTGTMRRASLLVVAATGGVFQTHLDGTRHVYPGDSGGACFVNVGGKLHIAGVAMSNDASSGRGNWASAEAIRSWAYPVLTGNQAPTEAIMSEHNVLNGVVSVLDNTMLMRTAADMFLPDGSLTSIKLGSMLQVRLYDLPNFGEPPAFRLLDFGDNFDDLTSIGWNDRVSSVLPIGRLSTNCPNPRADEITVWRDANFQGPCEVLKSASFDDTSAFQIGAGTTSIKLGSAVRATLYTQPGFAGSSLPVTADVAQLDGSFNDQVRSLRINDRNCAAPARNQVVMYRDHDYLGGCSATFTAPFAAFNLGTFDKQASSFQIGPEARLALFEGGSLTGAKLNSNIDHPRLRALGWNDRGSSVWVRSSWLCGNAPHSITFWENANYTGRCIELGAGEYRTREEFVLDVHVLTSFQVGSQVKATLFADEGFGGVSLPVTSSQPNLANVGRGGSDTWDNFVSSVNITPR